MNRIIVASPQPRAGSATRRALGAVLLIALAMAGWHIIHFIESWRVLAVYPYGIDYGEGIVWQQMLNIRAGKGYAPLGTYPAIVYHYPPVYHWTTGAMVALFGGDPLVTGRIVSAAATLGSAGLIAVLAAEVAGPATDRTTRGICAAAAAAAFLISAPVVQWGAVMRVDMLACAFTLGGLWLTILATRHRGAIHGASVLFALAVYTKQVAIAAPLAGVGGLMFVNRRLALICLFETALLGLTGLVALEWATGGEFLRHVVLYNVNRIDWSALKSLIDPIKQHVVIIILAVIGASRVARARRGSAARAVLLAFLAIKILMLAMIVKSGANTNYLIEAMAAVAIFAGPALTPVIDYARGRATVPDALPACFAALLVVQVAMLPTFAVTHEDTAQARLVGDRFVSLICAAPKPVISDDMTFLLRAGKPVEWEPAIVAELSHLGRYDEAGFIRMVRAHHFAFFLTEGDRGIAIFDARYNPPVLAAIEAAYPRKQNIEGYILRLPAG